MAKKVKKSIPERLKEAFAPNLQASMKSWESLEEAGEVIGAARDDIIKEVDEVEQYFWLVLKGGGCTLLWDESEFACVDLGFELEIFGDYMSFLQQQASPLELRLLEPSKLFRMDLESFNEFTTSTEFGKKLRQVIAEKLFMRKQQQRIDSLLLTHEEWYQSLLERQDDILQRTPLKYLASFMGISIRNLSRIRRRISVREKARIKAKKKAAREARKRAKKKAEEKAKGKKKDK